MAFTRGTRHAPQQYAAKGASVRLEPITAELQVAAGTRAGGGARVSADRTTVRPFDVLGLESAVVATDP